MIPWNWLWIAWLVAFAGLEAWAVWRKRRGDAGARTLTDLVTWFRDLHVGSLDVGRFLLAAGLLWLVGHFFGVW